MVVILPHKSMIILWNSLTTSLLKFLKARVFPTLFSTKSAYSKGIESKIEFELTDIEMIEIVLNYGKIKKIFCYFIFSFL